MTPEMQITIKGFFLKAKGRRQVDKAVHFLTLLNCIEAGDKITQRDMKKLTPECCQHIVKAICLRQAKRYAR